MRNTEWLFDSNSTGSTTFRLITTDGVLIPVTRNPDSSPTYFSFRGGRILGVLVETRGFTTVLIIYVVNIIPLNPHIDTAQPFASPPSHVSSSGLLLLI